MPATMRARAALLPGLLFAILFSNSRPAAPAGPGSLVPTPRPRPCRADEVLHSVTGPRPGSLTGKPAATCPASPTALDDVRPSQLYYFDHDDAFEADLARRGFLGFVYEFEQRANYPSDRARGGFHPEGSTLWVIECYYVGCTKVQVAAKGVSAKAMGRSSESCIGPLPGGTSVPAPGAPLCPAAVRIAGEYRSLSRSDQGRCCYPVPPPVPPSNSGPRPD